MNDAILKLSAVGKRFPGVVALPMSHSKSAVANTQSCWRERRRQVDADQLLAGIYVPDEGEIDFDGKPIGRHAARRLWRRHPVVHQELSMLVRKLTVAENLLFESLLSAMAW